MKVEMLRQERAKLESPVDRILFDNDPANGSIATRIEVMLAEPDEAAMKAAPGVRFDTGWEPQS